MRKIGTRLTVALAVATIGLFGAGAPAHGDINDINHPDYWVQWADNENQGILWEFTNAAVSACTMAELDQDRDDADSQLEAVWTYASGRIILLVAGDPAEALEPLEEDHNDAHEEVAATYALVADAMGPCATTTTTPGTTTPGTTTPGTTTTTTTTSSTTTTAPRSTTTSSTTTTEPTTTTTRPPTAVFVGEPPGAQGGTAFRPDDPVLTPHTIADPVIDVDDAMTSALLFDADGIAINDGLGDSVGEGMAHTGMISGMFAAGASVLLPPGLVQKAVGPIIAMEFLVRTLIESLGTMIVPLTVFLMAAGFVIWRESRRSAPITG